MFDKAFGALAVNSIPPPLKYAQSVAARAWKNWVNLCA